MSRIADIKSVDDFVPVGCKECRNKEALGLDFSMAFQPIVDIETHGVFGYEALVRGLNNEAAYTVLEQLNDNNRYRFDQTIRVKAIDLASSLGLQGMLSINFLPNAVYKPETCIRATLEAASEMGFPTERIMFEVTEGEKVTDHAHLHGIFAEYKKHNFTTAIDDFGAGYAGLNLLADWQPDVIKLDMALTRNIDKDRVRRSLVFAILTACRELEIKVIAEGIESREECLILAEQGVRLFQGYYFAKPGFETLPEIPEEIWSTLV
ncbi:diguanylate phosphodiesterase [Novimethylophilus kurashikiensis]|uniref:Diguanylate phosphodiesterase n=1 Tax=Novimethylophilus kurashikiensis TaxID=1825523 RepID=A0A2R5F1R8_9PROT|nr:EAL domain-containing protein [Novimethylophilus kurashikiensis]GBG12622.1 diguanylate phosphodiesterase [Novimethylophilus kurashikiensis]